jgi:hypothetical protein
MKKGLRIFLFVAEDLKAIFAYLRTVKRVENRVTRAASE